tara:strand:+ start:86 stop:361 length:276 start_codon:yes stop_codon:yes gene_type:complete
MSLGKKDIVKNIFSKAHLSFDESNKFLNKFIDIISSMSKGQIIKISNFGTFYYHDAPKRIGRNPKTKEEFVIKEISKLSLKVSKNVKELIN